MIVPHPRQVHNQKRHDPHFGRRSVDDYLVKVGSVICATEQGTRKEKREEKTWSVSRDIDLRHRGRDVDKPPLGGKNVDDDCVRHLLDCPEPKVIEFAPLFRFSLTGTLITTPPPPESGWSTKTEEPPFTLFDLR